MKRAWSLALRNLSRNRRRNLVTGLAIAFGYAGIVLLGGYATRIERNLRTSTVYLQHAGHVTVYAPRGLQHGEAKPSAHALDAAAAARVEAALRADPRVEFTGRYLRGNGIAGNGCESHPFRGIGVDLEAERRIAAHPQVLAYAGELARPRSGRGLLDAAAGDAAPIAAGVRLSKQLGKVPAAPGAPPPGAPQPLACGSPEERAQIGADPFVQLAARTHDGSFAAADAELVGTFQAPTTEEDKSAVAAGLETMQRLLDTDRVTYVAGYLRDARDAAEVAAAVSARLAGEGLAVDVYRYDDPKANPYYVGTIGFLGALIGFIGILVATVVALSVLNAMTLSVLERTRELGTFRSLGFTRRQLLGLFLREAAALAGLALAAGLALGLVAAAAVNASGIQFEPPGVGGRIPLLLEPDPALCTLSAGALLVLSLAASLVAVRRKTRAPVAALVSEVTA